MMTAAIDFDAIMDEYRTQRELMEAAVESHRDHGLSSYVENLGVNFDDLWRFSEAYCGVNLKSARDEGDGMLDFDQIHQFSVLVAVRCFTLGLMLGRTTLR